MLECANGKYYTGWSTDPFRRLTQHNSGLGARYTRMNGPSRLVYVEEVPDHSTALKHEMEIIFCFGEELKDRQSGQHFNVVENQLKDGLFHLEAAAWKNIILAYEPVWAIGTGETASPDQAQEMHDFIRDTINKKYGNSVSEDVSILYGGSVKPENAAEIFSKPDVDGGLIGGAALKSDDFTKIVLAI